jgi:hypothetical protein
MIELTPQDSAALVQVTQYQALPKQTLEDILDKISQKAQQIGRVILGWEETSDPDVLEIANLYRDWYQNNLDIGKTRVARSMPRRTALR